MNGNWKFVELSTIATVRSGKRLPMGETLTSEKTPHPYIRLVDINAGRVRNDGLLYLKPSTQKNIAKYIVKAGDICLAIVGHTIGLVFQIDEQWDGANLTENAARLTDFRGANPKYIYYYLNSQWGRELINSRKVGSAQGKLPLYAIASFPIPLPPLSLQNKIASILGSLDDKIELNRRMNATLESMAEAIFKSWFIDFDPVHRNASARSGGKIKTTSKESSFNLASDVDSLFPASFEESDIGPIPKGWTVELLGNHATVTRGLSYKGSGLADFGKPMFNLNSVLEGGGYKKAGLKYYTGDYFDKHEVLPGDLIVANTEQGFDHLLIGYAAVVPEYFAEGGIYSHHVYRVRPTASSTLTPRYLERWINSPLPHDWITGYSNGTTVNMLPVDGLTNAQVLLPPSEIVRTFTNLATSIAVQQQANDQASMHYSQTRDLLLPQLMSGSLAIDNSGQE